MSDYQKTFVRLLNHILTIQTELDELQREMGKFFIENDPEEPFLRPHSEKENTDNGKK